jgi:Tfp pilus assembly protein PilF
VRADPGSAEAHNTLANAYLMESRLDEAIAEYREALRLDPGLGAARRNLEKAEAARRAAGGTGGAADEAK